jgi:hypothetical protein
MDTWGFIGVTAAGSIALWRAVEALRTGIVSWEKRGGIGRYASRRDIQPRGFWLGVALYVLVVAIAVSIVTVSAYRWHMGLG